MNDDMDSKNLTDFLITPDQRDDMLAKHPYQQILPDQWNNIPVCLVKAFKLVADHQIHKDMEYWEKLLKLEETTFKMNQLMGRTEKKQKAKDDSIKRGIEYLQTSLYDRVRKLENTFDQRLKVIEESLDQFKRMQKQDLENMKKNQRDFILEFAELKTMTDQKIREVHQDNQNDKLFMMRTIDNNKRDLIENYLTIQESVKENEKMVTANRPVRQYVSEKISYLTKRFNQFEETIKRETQEQFY